MTRPLTAELHCPADHAVLCWIRSIVVQTTADLGFDESTVQQIELSVDEACANVVDHAYDNTDETFYPLIVRFIKHDHALEITVIDQGRGAGKSGAESIEDYIAAKSKRGLGKLIMEQFMDEVEFSQTPGVGTQVSMLKRYQTSSTSVSEDG